MPEQKYIIELARVKVHLHWGWAVRGPYGGVTLLRGLTKGFAVCGTSGLARTELAAFTDDATCPTCLALAAASQRTPATSP